MKVPTEPRIGAVISYSYLWADEADLGRRESKYRLTSRDVWGWTTTDPGSSSMS